MAQRAAVQEGVLRELGGGHVRHIAVDQVAVGPQRRMIREASWTEKTKSLEQSRSSLVPASSQETFARDGTGRGKQKKKTRVRSGPASGAVDLKKMK